MALKRSPELKFAMKVIASVEKEMPIKGFSCFSSGGHFVQWSKTILAILVESHSRNISMKLFCSGGHFVQPSTTILAYLVEGQPRNISVQLFENWSFGLGADII